MARLATVADAHNQMGIRHTYVTILTIALAAITAGGTGYWGMGRRAHARPIRDLAGHPV